MSMPSPKMLIAVGCVVEVQTTAKRSTLVIYRNEAEIKALHPYFSIGTNAADILAQTATIVSKPPNDDPNITHKSIRVTTRHVIRRVKRGSASTSPANVRGPHKLEDGYYYWLLRR